jgi:pilus assembly protein Flp/PilA
MTSGANKRSLPNRPAKQCGDLGSGRRLLQQPDDKDVSQLNFQILRPSSLLVKSIAVFFTSVLSEGVVAMSVFAQLMRSTAGATAIEYGLIAALISIAAVTIMSTVGTNLSSTFNTVASYL